MFWKTLGKKRDVGYLACYLIMKFMISGNTEVERYGKYKTAILEEIYSFIILLSDA